MNNTIEEKLKDTFDAIAMPAGLKESTLNAIEAKRNEQVTLLSPIERTKRNFLSFRRALASLAACFLLVVCVLGGHRIYTTETALVIVELNPTIELGVNRFNVVVDARAGNPDGALVLDSVEVVGKSLDQALLIITTNNVFLSFVNDTSFVDIFVTGEDEQQAAALVSEGEACIKRLPYSGASSRVSAETHHEAASAGMGIRHYETAKKLMSLDPSVTLEDCQSMHREELQTRITEIERSHSWGKEHAGEDANEHDNAGQNDAGQGGGGHVDAGQNEAEHSGSEQGNVEHSSGEQGNTEHSSSGQGDAQHSGGGHGGNGHS